MNISSREQKIIDILLEQESFQSSKIHELLAKRGEHVSLVTVKRTLSDMTARGTLLTSGSGRSSSYEVSVLGRIFADIDARAYCTIEHNALAHVPPKTTKPDAPQRVSEKT